VSRWEIETDSIIIIAVINFTIITTIVIIVVITIVITIATKQKVRRGFRQESLGADSVRNLSQTPTHDSEVVHDGNAGFDSFAAIIILIVIIIDYEYEYEYTYKYS